MKKNLLSLIVGFVMCFMISCAPTINYLGTNYKPTKNVRLFFDGHDIKKSYKVIGVAKNESNELDLDDTESVKQAMIEKAKSVGADAILFEGYPEDREASRSTDTYHDKDVTFSTSQVNTVKIYRAKFLKFN